MAFTAETVVVVDSQIERVVLATEETTQQVSHRLIKCQSHSWSQTYMKGNGLHHGDTRTIDSCCFFLKVPFLVVRGMYIQ